MAQQDAQFSSISYEVSGRVALVKLNRPDTRNALDRTMLEELEQVWKQVNDDEAVSVAVLAAAGDIFSDGAVGDSPGGADAEALRRAQMDWLGFYSHRSSEAMADLGWATTPDHRGMVQIGIPDRRRGRPAKPLITAIQGACTGRALSLLTFADFAICSDDAEFFDRRLEVSEPPLAETWAMIKFRAIPRPTGLRMAFQGAEYRLDAQRAYDLGTVTEVVSPDELLPRALELAGLIAEASPAATKGLISGFWSTWDLTTREARFVGQLHAQQARTIDGAEGYSAWVAGRAPDWPSRTSWSPPWPPVVLKV